MLEFVKDIIKRLRRICKSEVLSAQSFSLTLTKQEWYLLDGIIQTGILNMTQESREEYNNQIIKLFDKMNEQFVNFNTK